MEFNILGPMEVTRGDEPLDLGGPKQRAVLAVLVLSVGRVVTVDRIVDELWGDEPPARALACRRDAHACRRSGANLRVVAPASFPTGRNLQCPHSNVC